MPEPYLAPLVRRCDAGRCRRSAVLAVVAGQGGELGRFCLKCAVIALAVARELPVAPVCEATREAIAQAVVDRRNRG